jgi:hypothetical protein
MILLVQVLIKIFLNVFQKFSEEVNDSVRKLLTHHNVKFARILEGDAEQFAENNEYTCEHEKYLDSYTSLIWKTIDLLSKQPKDSAGPLLEVELWRSRYIQASSVCEELDCPRIPQIIQVLDKLIVNRFQIITLKRKIWKNMSKNQSLTLNFFLFLKDILEIFRHILCKLF